MNTTKKRMRLAVFLVIALGGVFPLVVYQYFVGRMPTVTSEKAKELLQTQGENVALVDVRSPTAFSENHLAAAQNWPYEQIVAAKSSDLIPESLRDKRLLLICQSGILSSLAAQRLHENGVSNVANVLGGMQTWIATGVQPCAASLCQIQRASGETSGLPFHESSLAEQIGTVLTGFGVKPFYTTLSFIWVIWLWRRKSPDLVALRWALIAFFVGENCCAINYLLYTDRSFLFEYLHSFGMVVCFGLTVYALLEGVDRRLIHYSNAETKCAALPLCRGCIKYADVPCGFRRLFLWLIPAAMSLCFMPFTAEFVTTCYNTVIFGTPYNYSHAVVYQIFEVRYLPAVALLLLAVSWGLLIFKRVEPVAWSKIFFAAGMGAMGFSFFRMVLLHVYSEHLAWFAFWEEITELIFVAGAGLVLWVFRHGLFKPTTSQAASQAGNASHGV